MVRLRTWARWEARLVRIYNQRRQQIALHTRHEPGKFATDPAHIHDRKRVIIERGADWLLDRTRLIGKYSGTWAESLYRQRGVQGIRVLQGLLALAGKHPVADLERACQQAIEYGAWRLRPSAVTGELRSVTAVDVFRNAPAHPRSGGLRQACAHLL